MRVLDAFELVRARTTEHHAEGEGAGLTIVMEQLGIDPDDMEAAMPSVFYEHAVINMPVPAQLVAAFTAGAVYTRANHSSATVESPETRETMVGRIEGALGKLERAAQQEGLSGLSALSRHDVAAAVLAAALGGPAAGPPADGGAGSSSPEDRR